MAGVPAEMSFNSGMEDKVKLFNAKKVYRIVTVQQPPFMRWNETTRKILNFPEKKIECQMFYELLIYWQKNRILKCIFFLKKIFIFAESYEGYCHELIEEIAKILK